MTVTKTRFPELKSSPVKRGWNILWNTNASVMQEESDWLGNGGQDTEGDTPRSCTLRAQLPGSRSSFPGAMTAGHGRASQFCSPSIHASIWKQPTRLQRPIVNDAESVQCAGQVTRQKQDKHIPKTRIRPNNLYVCTYKYFSLRQKGTCLECPNCQVLFQISSWLVCYQRGLSKVIYISDRENAAA